MRSRMAGQRQKQISLRSPICSGARAVEGINDLATLRPELAKQWSRKNGKFKPTMVTVASHKLFIWSYLLFSLFLNIIMINLEYVHNLAYFFFIELCGSSDIADVDEFVSHKDHCNVVIGWMPIDKLEDVIIYSEFLKKKIFDLDGFPEPFISR